MLKVDVIIMADFVQVTFKLDSTIHHKLKYRALDENRTQKEIITQAILEYLERNDNQSKLMQNEDHVEMNKKLCKKIA